MPIYEFCCLNCNHHFEELCPIGTSKAKCPACASDHVQKKISTFSAQSKGSEGQKSIGGGHSCGSCHGGSCSGCH